MPSILNDIKAYLKRTAIYPPIRGYFQRRRYNTWVNSGRTGRPPHLAKQITVREYADRFNLRLFVETGTYLGDMIDAVGEGFEHVFTIELGDELYERARRKFSDNPKVTVMHGDSGTKIREVLTQIERPALFWLDAHYTAGLGVSGRAKTDTPILAELEAIMEHPLVSAHVILIDDAHEFTGEKDYPPLSEVEYAARKAGYATFEVRDNIIRVHNHDSAKA